MDTSRNLRLAIMETPITTGQLMSAAWWLFIVYAVGSVLIAQLSSRTRYLRAQNWNNSAQKRWLGELRAKFESFTKTRQMVHDGYATFTQHGKPFVVPQLGQDSVMILNPKQIHELLQKPDNEVDLMMILREVVAARWTGDTDLAPNPVHLDIVRHQLTRKLPLLAADVYNELILGFADQWKTESEWSEVPALQTVTNIISRAANRVFSGPELCRNDEFLQRTRRYGLGIFMAGGIIGLIPWFLRPVLAPPIAMYMKRHLRLCKKHAIPVIKQRIAAIQSGDSNEARNDALWWLIEECVKRGDPVEMDPDRICRRIMRLNMVAIHTTSITMTNTLLDLYSSPRTAEFVQGLREECTRVLAQHGGQWNKHAVNDLYRIDSTIKESMRYSSLGTIGVNRTITNPNGISLSDGLHIPAGVRVAAPNDAIHKDPAYYPDSPKEYDAFRFSKARETLDGEGKVLDKRNQGIITTGEGFLAFGHGRHACPGRFFASQEMKLMLAHVVMHYDVRIEGGRPKNLDLKAGSIPSGSAKLELRRRQT